MIRFTCQACGKSFKLPDEAGGRRGRCKGCGEVMRVPLALSLEQGTPRRHHYSFAHAFLPAMCLQGPPYLLGLVLDAKGELLRKGWEVVASKLDPAERLEPAGLEGSFHERSGGLGLALVQLPPPRRQAEAIFVAGAFLRAGGGTTFRYLTLELGLDVGTGRPHTVLGEWVPAGDGGRHLHWGEGPPPEREAFLDAVEALVLDAKRQPLGSAG
ncbi:MAG: hypothetical protein AB7N76_16360 [Planctomycetota bacterium]